MRRRVVAIMSCLTELAIIVLVSTANCFSGTMYYVFYNLLYGIVVSTLLPLYVLFLRKSDLSSIGLKKLGKRQILVLLSFSAFSITGQIIPKFMLGETINFHVLPIAVLPLVMTSFFEEFLFRGFFQTLIQKYFDTTLSLIASGLLFSLYHLGYPGFRTVDDILLLFAVGVGFAVSFYLSNNNLFVSYFVNLPNAFITYILKYEKFPQMTITSSVYAVITIILIGSLLLFFNEKLARTHQNVG